MTQARRAGIDVSVENGLPLALPAGTPSAVFLYGHCFHRHEEVVSLALCVGDTRHRPAAVSMPRRDLHAWLHGCGRDPESRSFRSGFWTVLPVAAPRDAGAVQLHAAVGLRGGAEALVSLGAIPVTVAAIVSPDGAGPVPAASPSRDGALIAVCMATYEPDMGLFEAQIESLRAQSDQDWRCVVSDGGSHPDTVAAIARLLGEDPRFALSQAAHRLDPYRNFERALTMVPAQASLIALCDQDDRWYPEKLATLRRALGDGVLVYSDQRLVTGDGILVRDSLWEGRRNEWRNLASLLVANTVPGAAMLFHRSLLDTALPFPDLPGFHYHDHWLALTALASGEIRYVDRPLYDYVQHGGAVMGDVGRPAVTRSARGRRRRGSRGLRDAYFGGWIPREIQARTLLLRCADTLTPRARRTLERFVAVPESPVAFAWLALRPLRALAGRGETLGGEAALVRGIVWRRLVGSLGGRVPVGRRPAIDASFPDPPRFEQPRLRRWRAGT